jgi:hypothetical protein
MTRDRSIYMDISMVRACKTDKWTATRDSSVTRGSKPGIHLRFPKCAALECRYHLSAANFSSIIRIQSLDDLHR